MNKRRLWVGLLWMAFLGMGFGAAAEAAYLDEGKTFSIKGKVESRFTFKTQDSKGWATVPSTDPNWPDAPNLDAGDMIQQRNIVYIETDYEPKKSGDWELKFHATGRFLYDSVYESGPQEIRDIRDFSEDYEKDIDEMARDADLWEGYVDMTNGPLFIRVGRQKISWGETDVNPLLDRIMPVDNTYGGMFEDLDDRRVPLWALRSTYNFGRTGFFDDFGIEGFWEPAMIDQQFAPQTTWGSVYNFPQASGPPQQLSPEDPDDKLRNSRWGMRLQGVLDNNFNFALAYFQSYPMDPALKSDVDVARVAGGDTQGLIMEKHWIPTETVGGSFSFFESFTEAIFRGEVAYTFDEPYFDPAKNLKTIYAFLAGNYTPPESEIPEWDVLRFSLAFDRPFWCRAINDKGMINWTVEVSNEYYVDYDTGHVLAAPVYPTGNYVELHEWEHTIMTMLYSTYMSGNLEPKVLAVYNPRGAGFWQPTLQYRWDPWIFKVQYTDVFGDKDIAPGLLFDWDQISFSITYTF